MIDNQSKKKSIFILGEKIIDEAHDLMLLRESMIKGCRFYGFNHAEENEWNKRET